MDMDTRERRKALQKAYKEQETLGCVAMYENKVNGKYLIVGEPNMKGTESRFQFAQQTNGCAHMALQRDWEKYGSQAFTLTILDTLKKDPEQTPKEFKEEVQALAEMYKAGRDGEKSY
jgi:hypothetical protein